MNPFFSIVLPTYNRLHSLRQIFFPSLNKQDFRDYELIVVDDCSSDGTDHYFAKDLAREFPVLFERLVHIQNPRNLGAPASRNLGAAKARGSWLYIVEDDIQIDDPAFLSAAKKVIERMADDVGVICPMRLEYCSAVHYKNPPGHFVRIGVLSKEIYIDSAQEYSGFVENAHASSFVKATVYNEIKEDENLFYGNTFRDESDLYLGIRKAGYRIYYCGDILKSYHRNDLVRSGGQKKVNRMPLYRQELMVWKNHYRYVAKHYSLPLLHGGAFVVVRMVKLLANYTRLSAIKTLLSTIRL